MFWKLRLDPDDNQVIKQRKLNAVELGDKERFNKEPFLVTKCKFTS